jgi:hypothetical protein
MPVCWLAKHRRKLTAFLQDKAMAQLQITKRLQSAEQADPTPAAASWPAGWWILPGAMAGLATWVMIFRLVARLF